MDIQVTLSLSHPVYNTVSQFAEKEQQRIEEFLADRLSELFPSEELTPEDEAMERETDAYYRLHPTLLHSHLGKHVAIFNGKLVDSDPDGRTLLDRIKEAFPNEVVLIRLVETEPEQTLNFRSTHFVQTI